MRQQFQKIDGAPEHCSICQRLFESVEVPFCYNSAWPVNESECCDRCNDSVVIPARFTQLARKIEAGKAA